MVGVDIMCRSGIDDYVICACGVVARLWLVVGLILAIHKDNIV